MKSNPHSWIQQSITFQFIKVSILVLLLLIPASMIQSLIREREITRNEVGFNFAYLVASIAIIALIILYTFLYTILQFQDYALLIGSIGFFVVIALTMYLSRKIDWYGVIKED